MRGKSTMLGALRALFGAAFVADAARGGGVTGDKFVRQVLRLFDFGLDTRDIALQLGERESVVTAALWSGREARRQA